MKNSAITNNLFIDIAGRQTNCYGERICGDTFLFKKLSTGNRTIVVLSDGMGHGVKANILSTLTSSMIMNFSAGHEDVRKIGELILKTLPVCSVRRISYSTFTFLDVDRESGYVTIIEHDNPKTLIFRGNRQLEIDWERVVINESNRRLQAIQYGKFQIKEGDRIVVMSDGVTQSGLGSSVSPFGWGAKNVAQYIGGVLDRDVKINSHALASKVMSVALQNDRGKPKDDISCVVLHARKPRGLLLVSCPPSETENHKELADIVGSFKGRKAVCGYRVAEIIAQELNLDVERSDYAKDPDLPPAWKMDGFDLVTEGLATVNKTYDLLAKNDTIPKGDGPAHALCRLLFESDEINMVVGTKRNVDKNIYVADEFEVRRAMIKRLVYLLETKFMKEVNISYI